MKIELTMERTQRITKVIDISEGQLNQLLSGKNPFYDDFESEFSEGEIEYDYTVHDENERCLVDWK